MLLGDGRLEIMDGTAQMEWYQTHGNHVFDVFDYHEPVLPKKVVINLLWCTVLITCTQDNVSVL